MNKIMAICLALAACSCRLDLLRDEKHPPCVSACGMLLEDEGNGSISCTTIQEQEDFMIEQMNEEFCDEDPRFCADYACGQIFGWQVTAGKNMITWERELGIYKGLSRCGEKTMWLGKEDGWRLGSYPHELIHVIQDCQTGWDKSGEPDYAGPGHEGWESHGIYEFIREIRTGER